MADGTNINSVNFMALMNPEFAAKQQQFAIQQVLAQRLMEQGTAPDEDINKLANPGGFVVPYSPLQGIAKAAKAGVGGYLQKKALDDQLQAYKDLAQPKTMGDMMSDATNQAIGGVMGPATPDAVGQKLGGIMQQNQPSSLMQGMINDPVVARNAAFFGPDNAVKEYIARTSPTDLQKNVGNPITAPYMQKDLVGTGPGGVPVPYATTMQYYGLGQPNAPTPPAMSAPVSPPNAMPAPAISLDGQVPARGGNPNMTPADQNAAIAELYPPQTAKPIANPSPVSPQGPGGPVVLGNEKPTTYDPFNPNANKQREGLIEGDTKYLNETLLPAKDAALAANSNIEALQQAASIANSTDLTHTGPTAPARLTFIKYLNDFVSSTGGEPIHPNEIANADAINKIGLRLTANMTKMLGSREAAQIFSKIQEANPNWYMQPKTLNLVSNLIKGENDTAISKYQAGFEEARKGGLSQDGVNSYEKQNPGTINVKKAFAASGMTGIDDPKSPEFQQMPSGTQFYDLIPTSPTYGKLLTKH